MDRLSRDVSRVCQHYHSHDYLIDLNDLRLNNQLCDVTIKVNDVEVRAHKIIIASRLKYFKSRLLDRSDNDEVIVLENVSEANLESFISYAYTGELLINESNALSLLEDAHQLKEASIKKACVNFLEKHLIPRDAARALELANSIDCFELKIIATKMIPIDFAELSNTDEYLSLELEKLKSILSTGDMYSANSQQSYFEGVLKWILHDVESRRVHLVELLDLVDMTQLTADYLLEFLDGNIANIDNDGIERDIRAIYRSQRNQAKKKQEETSDIADNIQVEPVLRNGQADRSSNSIARKGRIFLEQDSEAENNDVASNENVSANESVDSDSALSEDQQTGRKLMITNMCDNTAIQFYDFSLERWSQQVVIETEDNSTSKSGAILNDKLFYVQSTRIAQEIMQEHVRVIDYRTEECSTLEIKRNNLSGVAVCACNRFLYLCGGITEMGQVTRRAQKYDPETNEWISLAPLITERTGAAAVFYDDSLLVLGGRKQSGITNSVETYDSQSMEWMTFPSMCEPRRQFAVAVLDGKLYACGGQQNRSVEIYDPTVKRWQLVAEMNKPRYGFLVIAVDGKLIAIGGDRLGTIEVYNPEENCWRMDDRLAGDLRIRNPVGGIIHSI